VMDLGPLVVMFQQTEVAALRKNVNGFVIGPSFDTNSVAQTTKN
jgi:peptide/nickel transport system substrate-binding protein